MVRIRQRTIATVSAPLLASVALEIHAQGQVASADPLPSWNDTGPKKAIVAFVERVTKKGSPDFVPNAERIATFDNDGTLWQAEVRNARRQAGADEAAGC